MSVATRSSIALAVLFALSACASGSLPDGTPEVETERDLVSVLTQLGYQVQPVLGPLPLADPAPASAYRVTQPNGSTVSLTTFRPEDSERVRSKPAGFFNRFAPQEAYLGADPRVFRKDSVVAVVFDRGSLRDLNTSLFRDLYRLLGRPSYLD